MLVCHCWACFVDCVCTVDPQQLVARLHWHRLPAAQQARLTSLLVRTDQLVSLQQRLMGLLTGTATPTHNDSMELDSIDRELVLMLATLFPSDQPGYGT